MGSPLLPPDITAQQKTADEWETLRRSRTTTLEQISAFLADAPLYRKFRYSGSLWTVEERYEVVRLPSVIKLFCPDGDCGRQQTWESGENLIYGHRQSKSEFRTLKFACRNCRRSTVTVFLAVDITPNEGELTKVGQYPALYREADPLLTKTWLKSDVAFYKKALTFRNANEGIAALPYLRRIIENHMRDVLDLIADAHTRVPIPGFDGHKCEEARLSRRFSDKLDFARDYLPGNLTPRGQPNPIGVLYELISEGLHECSEDDCVEIFDRCRAAFEYVVKRLTDAKREDEDYVRAIRTLNGA